MRPAQKSNRSRGRGNRKGGGGGNNINRVYDSAGPEGKVRGTPQQIIDKYMSLARDAQTSGDRVTAENFLQHAEHYQRILSSAMTAQEQARRENAPQPQPADLSGDAQLQPGAQPQPGGQPQPDMGEQPAAPVEAAQPDAAPQAAPQPAPQPTADIGGMAMIDAVPPPQDSLLLDGEEMGEGAPKKNGSGRRRSKPKEPTAEAQTAEAAPEAPEAAAES